MKYSEVIRSIAVSFTVGSLGVACASRGVQNVRTAKPQLEARVRGDHESTRYTSRVMSLADTRGISVLWFNAPIDSAETTPVAPVACATATRD
jgi:hypothetical protein